MGKKEYTININDNLTVSGSAEAIHELANVYRTAACECGTQIIDEIHNKHRNHLITELINQQTCFENIEKQLIDTIHDSEYYKTYTSKIENVTDEILKEIKHEEILTH